MLGAQYVTEAEEKLQRARLLVESVRKEKVDLSNQLEEERRYAPPPWAWGTFELCGPAPHLQSGVMIPISAGLRSHHSPPLLSFMTCPRSTS